MGAFVAPAGAQSPPDRSDVQAGRDLALRQCSTCHVVSADQPAPPKLKEPAKSFLAIANEPRTTAASLRAFIASTHRTVRNPANMPNPTLNDAQLTGVVAYILSLRQSR